MKSPVKKARQVLQEGRKLVGNRQKLILIADRSEHGWEVVKRYEADDLADDSEDEKKLKKAEKAAEKIAEKRAANKWRAGRGTRRPGPYGWLGGGSGSERVLVGATATVVTSMGVREQQHDPS